MKKHLKQLDHHINVFYDTESDVFVKYWRDAYPFKNGGQCIKSIKNTNQELFKYWKPISKKTILLWKQ